ncbi:MAG: TIGR02301 family protein [Rhizobiales bacterium]|nr:TIGR02301 family protein [Hyphomicrobiales bacterium]
MVRLSLIMAVAAGIAAAAPARAAEAPYEPSLMRLAEVLGSLHYLRNLCGESGDGWRRQMERLIETEKPDAPRKARFIASFNRGYRSFESVYSSCTASAVESIRRYMKEGEALTREVAAKYGN